MSVCCVYLLCMYVYIYIYIHTHACIYIFKCYVYILNTFIYDISYMNVNIYANIFKIHAVSVCIFYIYNKYTQYTLVYYVSKLLFWMRLITINRLAALINIIFYF